MDKPFSEMGYLERFNCLGTMRYSDAVPVEHYGVGEYPVGLLGVGEGLLVNERVRTLDLLEQRIAQKCGKRGRYWAGIDGSRRFRIERLRHPDKGVKRVMIWRSV